MSGGLGADALRVLRFQHELRMPPTLPRPPRGLLLALLAALLLWVLAWPLYGGHDPIQGFRVKDLVSFAPGEGALFMGAFLLEGLLVAYLTLSFASTWAVRVEARARELLAKPRSSLVGLAVFAALVALAIALVVVHATPLNEDEKTYLFQAKLLLRGKLAVEVPPEASAFWQPFIVGTGRWSGQYFWAQPALLAAGLAVGFPWMISAFQVFITVLFAGLLAQEYSGDRRVAVLTALFVALSPLIVFTGGTLHSSNLSAACVTMALWAVVRLDRSASVPATLALALATSIGLHTRPLDLVAMLTGTAIVLVIRHHEAPWLMLRRLLPAIVLTLPAIALHAAINKAVSGSYLRSGYWLFNEGHGWITMGFGPGPFDVVHTVAIAAAKTLTNLVRVAFYSTGTPFAPLALAIALLIRLPRRARLLGPVAPVLVYVVAYFVYAGAPIVTSGPVYYVALVPVLNAWMALALVAAYDRFTVPSGFKRLVVAFVPAQALAGMAIFWPPALREMNLQAESASQCETLVQESNLGRALVFVAPGLGAPRSWAGWPPLPSPGFDDQVLYPRQGDTVEEDAAVVRRFGEGRTVHLALCSRVRAPMLIDYDPVAGVASDLGQMHRPLRRSWRDENFLREMGLHDKAPTQAPLQAPENMPEK